MTLLVFRVLGESVGDSFSIYFSELFLEGVLGDIFCRFFDFEADLGSHFGHLLEDFCDLLGIYF